MRVEMLICDQCGNTIGRANDKVDDGVVAARFNYGEPQNNVLGSYDERHFCNKEHLVAFVEEVRGGFQEFKIERASYYNTGAKVDIS